MIITRSDEGNAAFVLTLFRVRVKALVQLRRDRQRDGKEKCANQSDVDRSAFHCAASFWPRCRLRN